MNRDVGIDLPTVDVEHEAQQQFLEKRRFPRRALSVRCWMGDGKHTLYVRLHDVSLGGISVRTPVPFSLESELELALVISGELLDPNGTVAVRARGRVVWVRSPNGLHVPRRAPRGNVPSGSRMGAEFMRFEEGEGLLRRLVEDRG